jgi:hypothetical protein
MSSSIIYTSVYIHIRIGDVIIYCGGLSSPGLWQSAAFHRAVSTCRSSQHVLQQLSGWDRTAMTLQLEDPDNLCNVFVLLDFWQGVGTWKVRNSRGLASPVLCEASTRLSHRHKDIEKPCASDLPPCVTQVAHWPTAVSQTSFVGGTSTSLDAPEDSSTDTRGKPPRPKLRWHWWWHVWSRSKNAQPILCQF